MASFISIPNTHNLSYKIHKYTDIIHYNKQSATLIQYSIYTCLLLTSCSWDGEPESKIHTHLDWCIDLNEQYGIRSKAKCPFTFKPGLGHFVISILLILPIQWRLPTVTRQETLNHIYCSSFTMYGHIWFADLQKVANETFIRKNTLVGCCRCVILRLSWVWCTETVITCGTSAKNILSCILYIHCLTVFH